MKTGGSSSRSTAHTLSSTPAVPPIRNDSARLGNVTIPQLRHNHTRMQPSIVRSQLVVTPHATGPAAIHIRDGRIERISDFDDVPSGASVDDYGSLVIMAGLVDSHVHVNEPGRTEWEGFVSATRAAAAGGITTIVDMPLNSIPATTSVEALMTKAEAMEGKCAVDVGLWGGAVPGNAGVLGDMVGHGALGFKCFLVDSGVAEFGHLSAKGLDAALGALRDANAPLLVHAELADPIEEARATLDDDVRKYSRYLASRPAAAEDEAIALLYRTCQRQRTRAHVVHLSSSSALALIRQARDEKVPLTAETTPHYLHLDAERIPDGATEFKCAPPIREHANRERLWIGVREEMIQAIVSDHSPCTPELKRREEGDFEKAWGGIASLQLTLPIVWSEARSRGIGWRDISALMSAGPARLAGLDSRKGSLAPGLDADLVVWAPEESFRVDPRSLEHRNKITPYSGEQLFGVIKATYLRGQRIYSDGNHAESRQGTWLRR